MAKFVNVSNHPSSKWSSKQLDEVPKWVPEKTSLVDIPFPNVPPSATEEEVYKMADALRQNILDVTGVWNGGVVHLMGEATLVAYLIPELKRRGVTVVCSTTERKVAEKDGVKMSTFEFVQFRRL